ncbi:hypothetical protein PAECIP111892_01795 [Paenibacillus auburnensis]|uniref:MarR family transcriptional regulator n=1 Tax=Paenibacillus auburnensis TaxID=2905649 RepID=A0ABN8G660_9BACL|nr:hypothetical protein [Paenibacillus auburnensis]CAH1194671.1 hypothetical protein PAECIP111892_01795 [Paenibacillus auburnensis]
MNNHINEENALLRDYILFPQLTSAVQRSIDELGDAPNVLNRAYSASGTFLLRKMTNDLGENRLALSRAGLRITRTAELNGLIHVEFTRKGKSQAEVYAIAREVLRDEMRARMAQYISEFGKVVSGTL